MIERRWKDIESEFVEYYEGEIDDLSEPSRAFLNRIGFIKQNGEVSEVGVNYLDSKFIFGRDSWKSLLRHQLLNLQEIRELCQSFYGQETKRNYVERFFKSKTEVSDEKEVGRILSLLNSVDILSYSKRHGTVQFKETDEVEAEGQDSYRTTRRTPYSNLMRFRKAIRSCAGDLLWVDRHFSKKGFEPLAEEVTGDKFDSVRILCGPDHVAVHMRDDFKRFREEMENRGVKAQVRVITEKEKLRSLHDRWLLSSKGDSWNIPPINSIYASQEAEILKTNDDRDFESWWEEAADIMDDWNQIQKYI
jgi:hypothetical protein